MTDLVQLERLIADIAAEAAGPSRPVDVAAVTRAATTQSPKWRFQTMFSATKFVVAGAIVALFGGFLLTGVLTTPQREESLPAASSPAEPTPSGEAVTLLWERVEIPAGMVYQYSLRSSTGTYLIASSPDRTIVSRDGLTWSEVPVQGEVIDAYGGSLVVADGDRLSTVRVAGSGAPEERLLAMDGVALPSRVSRAAGRPLRLTETAYGPSGLVLVAENGAEGPSIVWHTADGQSWKRVYRSPGEYWEEVIATEDGFVARTDRNGDFTVMHTTDGREWDRINERGSGLGRYGLVGTAPLGAVLVEPIDEEGWRGGTGALVVATGDGLESMTVPAEVAARWADAVPDRWGAPDSWGAGGLGVVGLGIADRIVSLSADGTTWHLGTLPDSVPRLLPGFQTYGRPILHVTEDVVLLETQVCLEADGVEVVCPDTEVEGHAGAWFRGTPSGSLSAPDEQPVLSDSTSAAETVNDSLTTTPDLIPDVGLATWAWMTPDR